MSKRGSKTKREIPQTEIVKSARVGDGFVNFAARMGQGTGNLTSLSEYDFSSLSQNRIKLEALYRGSWTAGAIIDRPAEDMVREGIEITSEMDPKEAEDLQSYIAELGVWDSLLDVLKWGRLYGGAIAVIEIDGQDYSSPLNIDRVQKDSFMGLTVYDRWQVQTSPLQVIQIGAQAGLPKFYTVFSDIVTGAPQTKPIHHSRVIRSTGIKLPNQQRLREQLWGESILEQLYDRIVSFDSATASATNLIQKAHLRTVSVENLRQVLAAGGQAEENLLKQFNFMRFMQNNEGISLIDAKDKLETYSYSFSGLSEMLLQFAQQLCGAAKMPAVVLFTETPSGLNATADNSVRIYYDGISAKQEDYRHGMMKILQVAYMSMTGKPAPDGFNFDFVPLWQTSQKEKAEIGDLSTRQILLAYDSGVITQATALKELKATADVTGIFSNISVAEISQSEFAPPPSPSELKPQIAEELKPKTSTFDSLKKWVLRRG